MARKLNISKDNQIKGLRKALANRKTPRAFIPSLKKRLAKLTGSAALIFFLCYLTNSAAFAQQPVSIVPTQQVLAPAGTACTGLTQTFTVNNRNQTQHYAYIAPTAALTNLTMQIQGVDSGGNVYPISDTGTSAVPSIGMATALTGTGYFPTVQVVVTCLPVTTGTFTLSYSGGQAISNVNVGSFLLSQIDKIISSNASAASDYIALIEPPYGNSWGVLYLSLMGTGSTGASLMVTCETPNGTGPQTYSFDVATTTSIVQSFIVPSGPCPNANVSYLHSGASTATYVLDYVFMQPGITISNLYTHITGTTATSIKSGAGVVHSIVVGTSAAGTISLFDLPKGSCTGTPASNTVSVITEFASATPPPPAYIFDTFLKNGICVKASAAMDITVSSQ